MEVLGVCFICGEQVTSENEPGEMHDPNMHDMSLTEEERMVAQEKGDGGLVHAQCGLDKGWVQS